MSNSPLVNYTKISPNRTSPRNHVIDTITIHCVVGQASAETLGNIFAPTSRQASSNYGIGPDGRIGMYCEEKDRSWCSSNRDNDHRAITIEVASDKTAPYAVTDKAYTALIDLVADICKRNNIKQLKWKADKNLIGQVDKQNMTVHRWFAATDCPGDYLYSRMGDIADKVNDKLGVAKTPAIFDGMPIKLVAGSTYSDGRKIPNWVFNCNLYARSGVQSDGTVKFSTLKTGAITGVVKASAIQGLSTSTPVAAKSGPYVVRVTASVLNIRKGPSTNYGIVGQIRDRGSYTIVETNGEWGLLKSYASGRNGWIYLPYTKKV